MADLEIRRPYRCLKRGPDFQVRLGPGTNLKKIYIMGNLHLSPQKGVRVLTNLGWEDLCHGGYECITAHQIDSKRHIFGNPGLNNNFLKVLETI